MAARFLAIGAVVLGLGGAAVSPAFAQTEEQVTAARARGVKFLKQQQKSDGSWAFAGHDVGITALCTIALVENGVPLTDPALQKGYEYIKKNSDNLTNTYDLSLVIVLLSRFGDRRDKGQIKLFAARLMAGQMDSGGWHYTCPGQKLDAEKFLKDPTTGPKPKEGYEDNSCTQFAVLGLWVASRSGVNVDRSLAKVAQRFVKTQADDGGWAYVAEVEGKKAGSKDTMTGAGLFCLAVAQANQIRGANKSGKKVEGPAAEGRSLLEDPVFAKGFKRTGDFVKGLGPGSERYFLWSVERVGVLLGLEQIGEVDWFQKGADGLLKTQKEEGGWPTAWGDKKLSTTYHRDENDLKGGFGVMFTLGDFTGGQLVFPDFRCAVDYQPGSMILADVHETHGNLDNIVGNRITCVLYAREKLNECGVDAEEEEARHAWKMTLSARED